MNMSVIDFAKSDSGHELPIGSDVWQVRFPAHSG
jgi:hypothetical protein